MNVIKVALLALSVFACRPDDQKTESIDAAAVRNARSSLPPQLVMHLDSGNAAYRRKDYPAAKLHYTAAVRVDQKQPAPWFGLYMVELAQGDSAAAQRALQTAQRLVPGASLIHPAQ